MSQESNPYQAFYDAPFPGRQGWSAQGQQRFTRQYMGGLHPRAKQTIGRRLALAASAVAYGHKGTPFTGPKLSSCSVLPQGDRCLPGAPITGPNGCNPRNSGRGSERQIVLNFDEELLGTDAVQVWPTSPDTQGLAMVTMFNCLNGSCFSSCGKNASCTETCLSDSFRKKPVCSGWAAEPIGPAGNGGNPTRYHANHMTYSTGLTLSPLEVQLNGTVWMPAAISYNAGSMGSDPIQRNCGNGADKPPKKPCVNFTRVAGWSSVEAVAPTAIPIGCGRGLDNRGYPQPCPPADQLNGDFCENCTAHFELTGVRYAWAESPCCPGHQTNNIPCPVNSCPISTFNSTLPAVPFQAQISYSNATAYSVGTCMCTPPQKC